MNLLRRHSSSPMATTPSSTCSISSSKSSSKRRSSLRYSWRPRTADEIARKKNRRIVSQHLKRIGKAAGLQLALDQDGICCFSFKKFVVVIEVPEDHSDICLFYSKVCHMSPGDNRDEVQTFITLYNRRQAMSSSSASSPSTTTGRSRSMSSHPQDYSQQDLPSGSDGTCACIDPYYYSGSCRGTRLGMKDGEINLCLSIPVDSGLSFQETADHLEHFIKGAVMANRKLQKVKSIPVPPPPPLERSVSPPGEQLSSSGGRGSMRTRLRLWSTDSSQNSSMSSISQCSIFALFASGSSSSSRRRSDSGSDSSHLASPTTWAA